MKKMMAVLLAVLIIGTTPAFAIPHGETADAMAVKGKGTAELAVQILENGSTGTEYNSTVNTDSIENNVSVALENDSDAEVQLSNDSLENNGVFVLENDTTENLTIPQIDTSGIVMQSSDFSCGPAALATVLNNLGVHATEQELIVLAGTDSSGTTMHGLSEAAKAKGLSATGMKLSVDDLRPNNIVHIILDGEGHYSVIREVSENSVYLADPSLGNIEMTREKFAEVYTGNALVITDPNMQVNQTAEQANNSTENLTDTGSIQPENLTAEEMESIKGQQLSASVPAPASMQLSVEEMQSIRGKVIWKVIAKAAAIGAVVRLVEYVVTTPRDQLSWEGAGRAALWGAIEGAGVIIGARKLPRKPSRRRR
ncbi:MAG: C39 family peptidase [Methanobacterium sp.]|jgi:predicted double-glycine peptidase